MPIVIVIGISIFIFVTLIGVFTFAASDMPLAMREIAINTRKREDNTTQYAFLKIMSVTIKIFAVLTWLAGIILAFAIVYTQKLPILPNM